MYKKKHMKNTKRHALGFSPHAAKLLQRRHLRLYGGVRDREGKEKIRTTHLISLETTPPSAPIAITTGQTTEETPVIYISITMLGKMTMTLHARSGIVRAVPLNLKAKSLQLLAYLAWQRSTGVRRDLLLERIWGHGKTNDEATREKLGDAFSDAKKALRSAVQKVVEKLITEQGEELLNSALDIFQHRNQMWWLSPLCRVVDLEEIEAQYKVIAEAERSGTLFNSVPEYVKDACYGIVATYTGDFLRFLTDHYPDDLDPWYSSWVREPITRYRDYYLQALWYASEYEQQVGRRLSDISLVGEVEKQRECLGRSAELYKAYAMSACNNQYDLKVFYGSPNRGDGERVKRSEEAMRNCIKLYGQLGSFYLIDETYNAYYDLMRDISDENWEPSEETLRVVRAARERAAAYRTEE